MNVTSPRVRRFGTPHDGGSSQFGDRQIYLTPAVERSEGGPLSAYSAFFGKGERADLPAPYEEIWVVVSGSLAIESGGHALTAGAGDFLHVPEGSPGEVVALEETRLVCVSVPAH